MVSLEEKRMYLKYSTNFVYFFYFGIEISFVELFEHFLNILVVYRHIIRVDKYIIKVDHDTDISKIKEYIVYESLEGCRSICKAK